MALDFSGGSTAKVDCGSDLSLDNLITATYMAWVQLASDPPGVNSRVFTKGLFTTGFRYMAINVDGTTILELSRATTDVLIHVTSSNFAAYGGNKWLFVAVRYETIGADTDQIMLMGDLATEAAEPSSYIAQVVGSGTPASNAAANQIIGNRSNSNVNFDGDIAYISIYNRVMPIAEIISHQFRPRVASGCVLFMHLGFNETNTQADWSGSGNNGTVTVASQSDHVPLGMPFGNDWFPTDLPSRRGFRLKSKLIGSELISGGLVRR